MNYTACVLQTEKTTEFPCFEMLQVCSVFDLIIYSVIENYLQIWKHIFLWYLYVSPII
jgi:hypothetical protein